MPAPAFPMLPVVAGRTATTRQILIYSGLLVLASHAALGARICRCRFMARLPLSAERFSSRSRSSSREAVEADRQAAHRLFAFSIFYLFVLFAALLAEHTSNPWRHLSRRGARLAAAGATEPAVSPPNVDASATITVKADEV